MADVQAREVAHERAVGGINVGAGRRASRGEHAVRSEPVAEPNFKGEKHGLRLRGKCVRGFRHLFKRRSVCVALERSLP